jgi:hypothetical protein
LELTGLVCFPGGRPAADVQVVAAAEGHIQLEEGRPIDGQEHFVATSDQDGRFRINALREPDAPFTLYLVHPYGTAIVVSDQYNPEIPVELTEWLTVQGEAWSDGKPSVDTDLLMRAGHYPSVEVDSIDQEVPPIAPMILNSAKIRTDREGRFRFDHVPARMEGDVHRTDADENWGYGARFVCPRERVGPIEPDFLRIDGCTVVGRVKFPEVKEPIFAAGIQSVIRGFAGPPGYDALPYDEQLRLYQVWVDSPEGQRAQRRPGFAQIQLDERGDFCVHDVPSGIELRLCASVYRNHNTLLDDLLRRPRELEVAHHFTLPEGNSRYDLGTIA